MRKGTAFQVNGGSGPNKILLHKTSGRITDRNLDGPVSRDFSILILIEKVSVQSIVI